ncbi:MAG TPA: cation:proton antiporter [Nocardioidaceae bacterium]|nr:cation:proton antiporter [Nocardioidaceae bacterium]
MSVELFYLLAGGSLLLAVVLPQLLRRVAVSAPMVLLVVGALIGLLPAFDGMDVSPVDHRAFTEHLTEFTVLIALMGVGLALDRGLSWRSWTTWKRWGATWRLLGFAMPLCITAVALLGWWVMGLAPAAAVLLGAALSPTDPVLASDVQVEGPTSSGADDAEQIDEGDEVRFALTSEAGLNDGLAFPFVYAAILMATLGPVSDWGLRWVGWELVGKIVVAVAIGTVVGWVLAKVAFGAPKPSLRLAETGEPLLALAAVLLSYGFAELAHGYGFVAVFTCALTLRSAERGHDYHVHMHQIIERLERLLTLVVLLFLGVAMTNGMLRNLTWEGVLVGVLLVFLIRPVMALAALWVGRGEDRIGDNSLLPRERVAVAFFGVRGVGSLFYLAYATGQADFGNHQLLWATVGFTVGLSVFTHGIAATPAMKRLDRARAGRPD